MEVIILSLIIAIFWAINPIITKHVLNNTSYQFILFTTNLIYFTCILIFSIYNKKLILKDMMNISNEKLLLISINTIVFSFISGLLYIYLLKHYDVNLVVALTYTSPIFIILLSQMFLNETITFTSKIGIVFIVIGGILISKSRI